MQVVETVALSSADGWAEVEALRCVFFCELKSEIKNWMCLIRDCELLQRRKKSGCCESELQSLLQSWAHGISYCINKQKIFSDYNNG
ncbi:hypothetical protein M0R45_002620 [Rubus argutus]|uniref:Uncharacterized protein n=1 Tax=Rubus argutus TaxID=59490 RepID=A0AAW1VQY0_RUBAR